MQLHEKDIKEVRPAEPSSRSYILIQAGRTAAPALGTRSRQPARAVKR